MWHVNGTDRKTLDRVLAVPVNGNMVGKHQVHAQSGTLPGR